jgi:hypothetical protein
MQSATVPETAVHKDRQFLEYEDKVRFAWQRLMSPPSGDAMFAKDSCELHFGRFVPMRANCRHYLRTFLLAENICHV